MLQSLTASGVMQRDIQGQLAVLSDRLYKAIRAEQVMPGESPAKRPETSHWRTVLVRASPGLLVQLCITGCDWQSGSIMRLHLTVSSVWLEWIM